LRAGETAPADLPMLPDPPARGGGWLRWLAPRLFDPLPTAVYAATLIFYYAGKFEDHGVLFTTAQDLVFGGVVLALVALDRLEYGLFGETPARRAGAPLLIVRLLLVGLALASGGPWWGGWLVPLVIVAGFTYFEGRGGFILAGLVSAGFISLYVGITADDVLWTVTMYLVVLALGVAVARTITDERASRRRAEALHADLTVAYHQLQEQAGHLLATWQDRNQLARDVHDSLGHYLTALNLQIAKALAYRAVDPAVADEALHNAQAIAREALADVRSTMGALQTGQDRFTLPAALERLCRRLAGSPVRLELSVAGAEAGFSPPALLALYRVAQEGLTNVQKHAQAQQAALVLRFTADAAILDLTDDGRGFAVAAPGTGEHPGGYGLQSMRERLEWVGGVLTISSAPGAGTWLQASVPRSAAAVAPGSPAPRPPELAVVAS
jgi:signal transduction histidine kinase